jgi:hypothetical protein
VVAGAASEAADDDCTGTGCASCTGVVVSVCVCGGLLSVVVVVSTGGVVCVSLVAVSVGATRVPDSGPKVASTICLWYTAGAGAASAVHASTMRIGTRIDFAGCRFCQLLILDL